jgi:hypothetical protein
MIVCGFLGRKLWIISKARQPTMPDKKKPSAKDAEGCIFSRLSRRATIRHAGPRDEMPDL